MNNFSYVFSSDSKSEESSSEESFSSENESISSELEVTQIRNALPKIDEKNELSKKLSDPVRKVSSEKENDGPSPEEYQKDIEKLTRGNFLNKKNDNCLKKSCLKNIFRSMFIGRYFRYDR